MKLTNEICLHIISLGRTDNRPTLLKKVGNVALGLGGSLLGATLVIFGGCVIPASFASYGAGPILGTILTTFGVALGVDSIALGISVFKNSFFNASLPFRGNRVLKPYLDRTLLGYENAVEKIMAQPKKIGLP